MIGSTVGAGSVVTRDIPAPLRRCRQPLPGYPRTTFEENTNKLGFLKNCLKTIFTDWNLKMIGNEEYRR